MIAAGGDVHSVSGYRYRTVLLRPAALPVGGDGDRSGVGDDGCDGGSTFGALAVSSTLLNAPQNHLAP